MRTNPRLVNLRKAYMRATKTALEELLATYELSSLVSLNTPKELYDLVSFYIENQFDTESLSCSFKCVRYYTTLTMSLLYNAMD